jgi:hypothetical protein
VVAASFFLARTAAPPPPPTVATPARSSLHVAVGHIQSEITAKHTQLALLHLADLAEGMLVLTEAAAQAVYLVGALNPQCTRAKPSVIDHYSLAR